MCGFTGYFLKNSYEVDGNTITKMLELQKHRGPDDSGILGIDFLNSKFHELDVKNPVPFNNSPSLIFGFNRLSIQDLSPAGHQPMIHNEAKVALMMNGEIYNAFDYKPELIEKGYVFNGNSDTEVVLNLYVEYGLEGMLNRLNGMFALAIYDGKKQELHLIRDRHGIKPLYILKEPDRISFASEIKSFKALSGFKFSIDETKISEFLMFRNCINNTLFNNIFNLVPGRFLTISSDGSISENIYYDVRNEKGLASKGSIELLKKTLKNSVKRQMISDVKLGCQLSGGVDSSLVTAFAAENTAKGDLETISIVFEESNYSEKNYIDQVVEKFNLKSHQYNLDAASYLELLDEAIWHFEQPLNHPNTIGIKILSREAKKHVTVLLSGEGADECLAGYGHFAPESTRFFSLRTMKRIIKQKGKFLDFIFLYRNYKNRYIMQTAFGNMSISSLLFDKFSMKEALENRSFIWDSINDNQKRKKRKYELLTYLPDLLMRQDKMSMAHTIENRVPFLDNEMIEVSLSIEDDDLVRKVEGRYEVKYQLKKICSEIFDSKFAFRKKMGFGIPLKSFFNSEIFITRWNNQLLPGIEKRGIFNHIALKEWMKNPANLTYDQVEALWLMIGFEIWATQFVD